MRTHHRRSNWALAVSILSLLLAGSSLVLTRLALTELRRIRQELALKRVSAGELDRLWAEVSKPEPAAERPVAAKKLRWNGVCAQFGASSIESFRRAVQADPVLAKRFADFRWEDAKFLLVNEARKAKVTYRQGDRISWTRRPVSLVKGETLVTDGTTTVRSFCCNEVSEASPPPAEFTDAPAAPEETSEGAIGPAEISVASAQPSEFTQPAVSPAEVTDAPIPAPPQEFSTGSAAPKGTPGEQPKFYGLGDDKPPPGVVPEPQTLLLFGTGAALLALWGGVTRRSRGSRRGE